jgi:hypothetical protein
LELKSYLKWSLNELERALDFNHSLHRPI